MPSVDARRFVRLNLMLLGMPYGLQHVNGSHEPIEREGPVQSATGSYNSQMSSCRLLSAYRLPLAVKTVRCQAADCSVQTAAASLPRSVAIWYDTCIVG